MLQRRSENLGSRAGHCRTLGTGIMNILAIDDDPIVLDLLKLLLVNLGQKEPDIACDGTTALKVLKGASSAYDCIFLDVSMPNIDGIELCKLLRSNKDYKHTPIIMLTARSDKASVDDAFRAGATDYLNKPLETVELAARLRMASILKNRTQKQSFFASKEPLEELPHGTFEIVPEHSDIPDLIDHTALCNYIAQLSKSGLATRQVTAVKMHSFQKIRQKTSDSELNYILCEVADTIRKAYSEYDCMMSYCGNGTFIVTSYKAEFESSIETEEEINVELIKRNIEYDTGDHVDIIVSIGNPIKPNTSKKHRVRRTFERAIARAQNRHDRKLSALTRSAARNKAYAIRGCT